MEIRKKQTSIYLNDAETEKIKIASKKISLPFSTFIRNAGIEKANQLNGGAD